MKNRHIVLAAVLGFSVGSAVGLSTDKFYSKSHSTGAEFRITKDMNIVQAGSVGANNALKSTDITGTLSASSSFTLPGKKISTPTSYTVGGGTTTTPVSEFGMFVSTGGALSMTATPTLATTTATNGQLFEIMSDTTTAITFRDNDATSGTLLQLNGNVASKALVTRGDVITFRYSAGKWYEVYYSTH